MVTGYKPLIGAVSLLDPATAMSWRPPSGHAQLIVRFNLEDFPADELAAWDVEAKHPRRPPHRPVPPRRHRGTPSRCKRSPSPGPTRLAHRTTISTSSNGPAYLRRPLFFGADAFRNRSKGPGLTRIRRCIPPTPKVTSDKPAWWVRLPSRAGCRWWRCGSRGRRARRAARGRRARQARTGRRR